MHRCWDRHYSLQCWKSWGTMQSKEWLSKLRWRDWWSSSTIWVLFWTGSIFSGKLRRFRCRLMGFLPRVCSFPKQYQPGWKLCSFCFVACCHRYRDLQCCGCKQITEFRVFVSSRGPRSRLLQSLCKRLQGNSLQYQFRAGDKFLRGTGGGLQFVQHL